MKIFHLLIIILFNQGSYPEAISFIKASQNDSTTFAEVEKKFNSLMDTTNLSAYKEFKWIYGNIIVLTSSPGEKVSFSKFDSLYIVTKTELQLKINGFQNIYFPANLSEKVLIRLEESKNAFIKAYGKLMDATESLYFHAKERLGFYLSDYNNYMLEFENSFNKGIIKFAQAKMKIK